MNTVPSPTTEVVEVFEENGGDIDSDDNTEELLEYYQPISTETGEDSDDNDDLTDFDSLSNGHAHAVENGILSLDLSREGDGSRSDKDEEEERMREVQRAFIEDERRRQAPLTTENAARVMEVMRGVSFGGTTPDWANQVPEDQWINQLRGLRHPPSPEAGSSS